MKTSFLPVIRPNKVAIYFQGSERWDTYLLPIIEGSCELENTLRSWRHCYNRNTLFLDLLPTLSRLRRQKKTYNIPPTTQVSVKSNENRVGAKIRTLRIKQVIFRLIPVTDCSPEKYHLLEVITRKG